MISCYGLVFARLATVCRPIIVCLGSGNPEVYTAFIIIIINNYKFFINIFQAIYKLKVLILKYPTHKKFAKKSLTHYLSLNYARKSASKKMSKNAKTHVFD